MLIKDFKYKNEIITVSIYFSGLGIAILKTEFGYTFLLGILSITISK